jgi:hypothetical protein
VLVACEQRRWKQGKAQKRRCGVMGSREAHCDLKARRRQSNSYFRGLGERL